MKMGELHTTKSWTRLIAELDDVMRKWRKEYLPPVRARLTDGRTVTIRWVPRADWAETTCSTFPSAEQNLAALVYALDAVRLADQRRLTGLLADATRHFALPSGKRDPYKVLGVSPSASIEDVKAAWRRKVMETHPDRGGSLADFEAVQQAARDLGLGPAAA